MSHVPCIIITSINSSDNAVLKAYATLCSEKEMGFIVAGDTKSPKDFNLPGCEFLSTEVQKTMPFHLAELLPDNNYAKKNLAYLHAIKKGHTVLVETDDDNFPLPGFCDVRGINVTGSVLEDKSWVNIYRYFSDTNIWPRGFSLQKLKDPLPELPQNTSSVCPVQQGLADENPDVDAFYRLSMDLPVYFNKREQVVLGKGSVCPFNSQNTTWFKQSFPLLYLPSYCSFRMTDIWRSFIAQRILWTCGWNLGFHNATVYQKRNEHNLLKDLEQEVDGYLHNDAIVKALNDLSLKSGEAHIAENLRTCYKMMVDNNYIDKKELVLLDAWLKDLEAIGNQSCEYFC